MGSDETPLCHLFFTDDLVLFGEATLENTKVIHEVLADFYRFSGQKVNLNRSHIFFF